MLPYCEILESSVNIYFGFPTSYPPSVFIRYVAFVLCFRSYCPLLVHPSISVYFSLSMGEVLTLTRWIHWSITRYVFRLECGVHEHLHKWDQKRVCASSSRRDAPNVHSHHLMVTAPARLFFFFFSFPSLFFPRLHSSEAGCTSCTWWFKAPASLTAKPRVLAPGAGGGDRLQWTRL